MTTKIVPNTFQTFNDHVDRAMAYLTGEEYKCLSFATRHILGWQDRIDSRCAVISLSMFEHGFTSESGAQYGGTGLSRTTIIKATAALSEFALLIPDGDPTKDGQKWKLGDSPDWQKLHERQQQQLSKRKQQTKKATQASKAKRTEGGTLDVPVVHETYQQQYVGRTEGGTLDVHKQNHIQNHIQNQKDSAAPEIDAAVADVELKSNTESAQPTTATPSEQKPVLAFSHSDDGEKAKEPPSVPRVSPTPRKQKPVFNAFMECAYGIEPGTEVPKGTAVHINKLVKAADDAFYAVFKSKDVEKLANAVRTFYQQEYPKGGKLTPIQKAPQFGAQFLAFIQTYRKPKTDNDKYSMPELPPVYQWSEAEIAQRKADLEALKRGEIPERKSA
jgi:hypothetical protein